MTRWQAMESGLAGALALTAVHETVRQRVPEAPRMDLLASRGIAKAMSAAGQEPLEGQPMYAASMAGDVLSNTLYYSLVGIGDPQGAPLRGALLGLVAGLGGVLLPPRMGLGAAPSGRTTATQAMTVGWYVIGGLTAGVAYRMLAERNERHEHDDRSVRGFGCCR